MLYSITEALGTGSPQLVGVPPFLSKDHITVYVNSLPFTGFEWVTDSTIRITAGTNHPIRVVRKTSPGARLSTYLDGQGLPADNLEVDSIQAFYLAQEALDLAYLGGSAGGNPAPGVELTTQGIKNLLAGQITPSELETTLRTTIGLIDANATIVNSPAWRVAQEALGRAAAITAEQQARAAALVQEALNRGAAITSVQTVLQGNIDSVASSVTTLTAATGANAAAIANEVTARTNQDTALAQSITTLTGTVNTNQTNLTATVNSDRTARINGDSALASTAETNRANLQSAINTVDARVTTVESASVTRDNALSSRVTTIEAAIVSSGGYDDTAIRADITAVDVASANRDTALGARVSSIRAGSYGVSLNADPEFKAGNEFWFSDGGGTAALVGGSVAGRFAFRVSGSQTNVFPRERVPVDQSKSYSVTARVRRSSDASSGRVAYVTMRLWDINGTEISQDGSWWYYPAAAFEPGTGWTTYGPFPFGAGQARTFPANAAFMAPAVIAYYNGSAGTVGYHEVEYIRLDDYEVIRAKTELQASINTVDSARVTDRDAAATRLTSLEAKVGSPAGGSVTAAIAAAQSALALADQAIATDVTTLQTSVTGPTGILTRLGTVETSASTTAGKVTGVESQWTLKVQARSDGKTAIAGIGLNSTVNTTVTQSELILMADRILFVPSGADFNGTPQPLLVLGQVNGQNTLVLPPSRVGDQLVQSRMIVEGSIEARHLRVTAGVGLNLWPDANYLDPTAWQQGPWGTTHTQGGSNSNGNFALTYVEASIRGKKRVPVIYGRRYRVSFKVYRGVGATGTAYLRLDTGTEQVGGYTGQVTIGVEGVQPTADTWASYSGEWVATTSWASPMVLTCYGGTGLWAANDIRIEEMIGGDVIVDGSLTAGKIDTKGLIVRDGSGNIILGAGNALNPAYAASGTLNADLLPNISTAQSTAISTASADATSKANGAISTASADATSKANAALSAAMSDATTKAGAAQAAAQTYADAKAALAETQAKAYADGVVDAEEARAIADATAKANAAQSNALAAASADATAKANVAATLATWAGVSGAGKPENDATKGATFGTNVYGQITAGNVSTYIASAAIGNAQIGGDLWSDNYNPGVAGWVIRRNGTAEFQSALFRGDVYATNLYGNVVDTGNIKDDAVSGMGAVELASNSSRTVAQSWGTILSTSVVAPSGGKLVIQAAGEYYGASVDIAGESSTTTYTTSANVRLLVNGSVVRTRSTAGAALRDFSILDVAPGITGTVTVELQHMTTSQSVGSVNGSTVLANTTLVVTVLKK